MIYTSSLGTTKAVLLAPGGACALGCSMFSAGTCFPVSGCLCQPPPHPANRRHIQPSTALLRGQHHVLHRHLLPRFAFSLSGWAVGRIGRRLAG